MEQLFDSLNPYQTLVTIRGDDPEDVLNQIKEIKTPFKIFWMGSHRNRFIAIIGGDIRASHKKKIKKESKNGRQISS